MANIILIILCLQLNVACLGSKPVYQRRTFPYSRCLVQSSPFTYTGVVYMRCTPINITKDAKQETPSQWPPGPYAVLMQGSDGCPEPESSGWKKGVFSIQPFQQDKFLRLLFCVKIKRFSNDTIDKGKWVSGSYSIYKSGLNCPHGFDEFNRSVAYSSFSHSGHVPNFTTIDDSGRRIVLYMCQKKLTDNRELKDELEFDSRHTEVLREKFVNYEDCFDKDACENELISAFQFSSGTIQKGLHNQGEKDVTWYQFDFQRTLPVRKIEIENDDVFQGNFEDLTSDLPDSYGKGANNVVLHCLQVQHSSSPKHSYVTEVDHNLQLPWTKKNNTHFDMYIGCTRNNVHMDHLSPDAESCYEKVTISEYYITLRMSYKPARFITLKFHSTDNIRKVQSDIFRIILFGLPISDICNEDLGMNDGSIQNFQIKASSWLLDHEPSRSRPSDDGWCADESDSKPWILVDLMAVSRIEGISIWPGRRNHDSLHEQSSGCLSLNLYHGKDFDILTMYTDTNFFAKSQPQNNVKTFIMLNSFDARFIKLEFMKCVANSTACLKFELHGCKLSGIPHLSCAEESDMFELDREIRPEGNPVIHIQTSTRESCSALCHKSKDCSVVYFNSIEEYCSVFPPSVHGVWQTTDTLVNQCSAKLCGNDPIELFPTVVQPITVSSNYILTNVDYIEGNAIIHSIGYPFSYGTGQNYMWIVNLLRSNTYARVIFTNLSFGDEGNQTKLIISEKIKSQKQMEINHQYNDRVFVIETQDLVLFLTFTTSLGQGRITGRGFRAIVTAEDTPACLLTMGIDVDRGFEICSMLSMFITSLSILNFPFDDKVEVWNITANTAIDIQIEMLDFFVICPKGTEDVRSRFVIGSMGDEKTYCNTEKPPRKNKLMGNGVIVKYQSHDDQSTVYLRKEGFRLRYFIHMSHLIDYVHRYSVCSEAFGKCYLLIAFLTTWDEASRYCMKCNMALVSIQSEDEQLFVNNLLLEARYEEHISVPVEDKYMYQASFSSHIGARQITNRQGKKIYVWENTAPVINFYWKRENPVFGKTCIRTNTQFPSHKAWESEECSTDLSMMFICQTPIVVKVDQTKCEQFANKPFDIAFLIDITPGFREFYAGFFIFNLMEKINIGSVATRTAVLTFSSEVKKIVDFTDEQSPWKLKNTVDDIPVDINGTKLTHQVLKEIRLRLYSPESYEGGTATKIGILLMNGWTPDLSQDKTADEVNLAQLDGIKLLAIDIGPVENNMELYGSVSNENYIQVDGYEELEHSVPIVLRRISQLVADETSGCNDVVWTHWKPLKYLTKTIFGTTCQNWNNLSTTEHHNLKSRFPNVIASYEMYNFCQDLDSSGISWCYTQERSQNLWEPCFLQFKEYSVNSPCLNYCDSDNGTCASKVSSLETRDDSNRTSLEKSNDTFRCNDGSNTSLFHRCDGVFNCKDFSDETKCEKKRAQTITVDSEIRIAGDQPSKKQKAILFHCGSQEWISVFAKCDRIIDCADSSDELNCSSHDEVFPHADRFFCDNPECHVCDYTNIEVQPRGCRQYEYQCKNKECILNKQRCDGIQDCLDGSDENECGSCKQSFHCDTDACIPLEFVCDNYPDCVDGADESECIKHNQKLGIGSCEELWVRGYIDSGYYLLDGFSVYCDFTFINAGEITTVFRNIDVDINQGRGPLYTRSKTNNFMRFKDPVFQNLVSRNNLSCFIEVRETCPFPEKLASLKDSYVERSILHDCQCRVRRFTLDANDKALARNLKHGYRRFDFVNEFDCIKMNLSSSIDTYKRYYNVTEDGDFYVDEKILKAKSSVQITPQQIVCKSEHRNIVASCGKYYKDHLSKCIYVPGIVGNSEGCQSGSLLQSCGDFKCPKGTVKCPGSYCIPLMFVCDGIFQCQSGEDEHECTCINEPREVFVFAEDTRESQFVAEKIGRQFYTSESNIRLFYFKTSTPLLKFNVEHRLLEIRQKSIYLSKVLDHSSKCLYKTMARNVLQEIKFSNYNTTGIVFIENSFESSKVAELMFANISKPGVMIYRVYKQGSFATNYNKPNKYKFVKDVPTYRWNALFYAGYKRFPEICKAVTEVPCSGGYRCSSSKQCIPLNQVCDGVVQCPEKDDEKLCDIECPNRCICIGFSVNCRDAKLHLNETKVLYSGTRIADLSQNVNLKSVLKKRNLDFFSMTKLNLSSCAIENVSEEGFEALGDLRCLDIGFNLITNLPTKVFNNLQHLVYLNLDGNSKLQSISHSAFRGLKHIRNLRITGTKLKIITSHTFSYLALDLLDISNNVIKEIEDYAFNGSSIQKIDFRGNNILTFNEYIFEGVSSLQQLQTPNFKFCCIKPCSVVTENCFPSRNEFSSCGDLMRHPVLQSMLWIVGSISLLGNFGSIFYRILYDRERLKIGYGIFVTNLAGADFLMGMYLIMIAIADLVFRNRYIYVDDMWRNSNWCLIAGILSTVSSEASVLFVCLITLDRLLVIKYPFGTVRFEPKKAYLSCIASWTVAILIAIFPVVYTDYFENSFYSRSAVCIALPLTRDKPPGWMYSVSIFVGLNFCTFVLVACGQLSIFLELRKSTGAVKQIQKPRKRDLRVARNLIFVATTDFLCWFPIGLMGIMALSGHPISGDVYAWTAVFILPLNSGLNPILYTLTAILGKRLTTISRVTSGMKHMANRVPLKKSFNPNIEEQNRTVTLKETASVIVEHQDLLTFLRIKNDKAPAGQTLESLLRKSIPVSSAMVVSIAFQLSKCMCLLHDCGVYIEQMSTDRIYLKVNKKKRHSLKIYLDSKLSVLNDEKMLQGNVLQFGQILRRLTAKSQQK